MKWTISSKTPYMSVERSTDVPKTGNQIDKNRICIKSFHFVLKFEEETLGTLKPFLLVSVFELKLSRLRTMIILDTDRRAF